MLTKTHLVIGIFAAIFFFPHVNYKLIFVPVVLIASILPDVDSGFSYMGKRAIFKPIQFLTKHRGIMHSFTFCVLISIILAFYFPKFAFPFFLGYGLHLFADSLTVEGIRPIWPLAETVHGKIRVGGAVEDSIFVVFCILSVIAFVFLFL